MWGNHCTSIIPACYLTNKSADGIVLLREAADLASQGGLQLWRESRVAPLC